MEFANRICPNCKNPNYVVFLGDFSKAFKYKCMNCNQYFNDIDFTEPLTIPVWKSKCTSENADMVEVVRCKDCKYSSMEERNNSPHWLPCMEMDTDYDWFCADGIAKDKDVPNK